MGSVSGSVVRHAHCPLPGSGSSRVRTHPREGLTHRPLFTQLPRRNLPQRSVNKASGMHRTSPSGILPGGKVARQARWEGGESVSVEENKAIQNMSHEEVAAALPKLREEAAKADARVHQAMERLAQTAEVPTYVDIREDHLVVDVRGTEKAMTLLSRLLIPLEHVQGAEADPQIEHTLWRGWRIPGVHLPGVRFYDVHGHRDKTIVDRKSVV